MVITLSHGVLGHGVEKIDTNHGLGQKWKLGPLGKTLVSLWIARSGKSCGGWPRLAVQGSSPMSEGSAGTDDGRCPSLRQSSKDPPRRLRGKSGEKDLLDPSSFLLRLLLKSG
ncbi:unnamed protein product, partial [Arabidopsis halleri]